MKSFKSHTVMKMAEPGYDVRFASVDDNITIGSKFV